MDSQVPTTSCDLVPWKYTSLPRNTERQALLAFTPEEGDVSKFSQPPFRALTLF